MSLSAATSVARRVAGTPVLPALASSLVLGMWWWLGPASPIVWGTVVIGGALVAAALARVAPALLLAIIPVSMAWQLPYTPILHYEAMVLLLALPAGLAWMTPGAWPRAPRDPVLWAWAVFFATLIPAAPAVANHWRYFAVIKLFGMGVLGYVVARGAARTHGVRALALGPALLAAMITIRLVARVAESGVPSFRNIALRVHLSDLGFATSNAVAAVIALTIPAQVLWMRETRPGSPTRWGAISVLAMSGLGILLTTSRGGALVAIVYVLLFHVLGRAVVLRLALFVAALGAALLVTPFAQALAQRFTNAQSLDSMLYRLFIWQAAWRRGIEHLPWGVGPGQGVIQFDELQALDAHNWLLTLFSEFGLVSLAAWLLLFGTLVHRARRFRGAPATRVAGDALLGSLFIAGFNSLFEPLLLSPLYHLLWWWQIGAFSGVRSAIAPADTEPYEPEARRAAAPGQPSAGLPGGRERA